MYAWGVRRDGYNLGNRRDAVAGGERGIDPFYRLPARSVWLSVDYQFGVRGR